MKLFTKLNSEALRLPWEGNNDKAMPLPHVTFNCAKVFVQECGALHQSSVWLDSVSLEGVLNSQDCKFCCDSFFSLCFRVFIMGSNCFLGAVPLCAATSFDLRLIHQKSGLQSGNPQQLARACKFCKTALSCVCLNKESLCHQTCLEELELAYHSSLGHLSAFFGDIQGILDAQAGSEMALGRRQFFLRKSKVAFLQCGLLLSHCFQAAIEPAAQGVSFLFLLADIREPGLIHVQCLDLTPTHMLSGNQQPFAFIVSLV